VLERIIYSAVGFGAVIYAKLQEYGKYRTYLGFISFLTKILKMDIFIYTSTHFHFSSFHLFSS